jgi:hypothetical protein
LGALGYLVMLEQIGKCYRPAGAVARTSHSLVNALAFFAPAFGDAEAYALWSLRCSFAHDYGLINDKNKKDSRLVHHFILDASEDPAVPVAKLPSVGWDGKLNNLRKWNATLIDLRALGDLAEEVFKCLLTVHEQGNLEIALKGGLFELQSRYALTIWPGLTFVDP